MLSRRSFLGALAGIFTLSRTGRWAFAFPRRNREISTPNAAAAVEAAIVCPADAPEQLRLAASEIRRYLYLRTGVLLPVRGAATGKSIVLVADNALEEQQYRLKTDRETLTVAGGSPLAVLYGAYGLAEKLGVRFYLHGDVIPDGEFPSSCPCSTKPTSRSSRCAASIPGARTHSVSMPGERMTTRLS